MNLIINIFYFADVFWLFWQFWLSSWIYLLFNKLEIALLEIDHNSFSGCWGLCVKLDLKNFQIIFKYGQIIIVQETSAAQSLEKIENENCVTS